MRRFLGTVAALAMLGATPALAGFADWDADDDAFLDREEFGTGIGETDLFQTYDVNENELLETEEVAVARYDTMDLDGDGELTVDEWDTWVDANIGEAEVNLSAADWDENGDDVISRAEFEEEVTGGEGFVGYDVGEDDVYGEDEFETGLFEDLDLDDDDRLAEDEFLIDNFGI